MAESSFDQSEPSAIPFNSYFARKPPSRRLLDRKKSGSHQNFLHFFIVEAISIRTRLTTNPAYVNQANDNTSQNRIRELIPVRFCFRLLAKARVWMCLPLVIASPSTFLDYM